MAIKTNKRVYAIFANCITPECKLYFSEQSSRYHPLSINIPKYYFFAPMLYIFLIYSLCTIAKVQLHSILLCSFLIYVVFALLRSITSKSPLHRIMFLSLLIYFVMGISFATALRFGALLICTQSVIDFESG